MIAQVQGGGASSTTPPPLLPLLGADDNVDATFERVVQPVAMRARAGDTSARNALFLALQPKILRFVRNIWLPHPADDRTRGVWDHGDVESEAFLIFAGVVDRWPPAVPFGRYFLAHFPWRLQDAVTRRIARRGVPPRMAAVTIDAPGWLDTLSDNRALDAQERALIEAVASSLSYPQDVIVRCHVLDGLTMAETAERLGVNRRTVTRHWSAILQSLRA